MGEITNLGSQTFCDRLCDFFKRIICPENSDEKLNAGYSLCTATETNSRSDICCSNNYTNVDNCGCAASDDDYDEEDKYLILTRMAQKPICDSYVQFVNPSFSAKIRMQLFPETLSAWSLALKRRRLERHCRKNPFVQYSMQFISNALKDARSRRMDGKFLCDKHEPTGNNFFNGVNSVKSCDRSNDDNNNNDNSNNYLEDSLYCITRPSSPCRSNSTLSSGYSSEELSSRSSITSNSSLSQYSYLPEIRTKDDALLTLDKVATVALPELFSDTEGSVKHRFESNIESSESILNVVVKQQSITDDLNDTALSKKNSQSLGTTATYTDDFRLRAHIERAFKYCKLFEILEQPSNRFRISPTTCGLGLPLAHLDRCWPPVNAVKSVDCNGLKYTRRRITSVYGKKQRRESVEDQANCTYLKYESTIPALGLDAMTLQYVSSSSSLSSNNNLFEQDGNLYVSEMDVLSEEIWDYHISTTQSEEMLNLKMQLRDVLYCALSQLFPMCGLYIVGSSLNGFGTNSSDMDLCLMISCKEINQRTDAVVVLDLVRSLFNNMNIVREQKLIIAKVPILRMHFFEPYANIVVDLNANNSVAIRNTQLLCYYSYYDWRVRPLVSVVKEWAKRRDINDANRSSFTSYSLVLMVIHYLQCEAKLLPSLQEKYPKVFNQRVDVRTLSVSVPLEPQGFCQKTFDSHDVPTLGELLLGFFEYFAKKFDYENDAISVRLGKRTERCYVANHLYSCNSRMSQWNYICIEEPFNYSNTAHSVHDQYVFDQIKLALTEDYEKLEQTRDLHAFLDVNPLSSQPENSPRNVVENVLISDSEPSTNADSKNLYCQEDCVDNSERKTCSSNDSDGCSNDFGFGWHQRSKYELLSNTAL